MYWVSRSWTARAILKVTFRRRYHGYVHFLKVYTWQIRVPWTLPVPMIPNLWIITDILRNRKCLVLAPILLDVVALSAKWYLKFQDFMNSGANANATFALRKALWWGDSNRIRWEACRRDGIWLATFMCQVLLSRTRAGDRCLGPNTDAALQEEHHPHPVPLGVSSPPPPPWRRARSWHQVDTARLWLWGLAVMSRIISTCKSRPK